MDDGWRDRWSPEGDDRLEYWLTNSPSRRCLSHTYTQTWASQVALVVKNPSANAGDVRDAGSITGSGRSSGGGHGNPLQDSCLESPMDREASEATVHRITNSWTWLKQLSIHTSLHTYNISACKISTIIYEIHI